MLRLLFVIPFILSSYFSNAQIITTVAGTGYQSLGGDGRAATSAWMNGPCDVFIDAIGNIFIADGGNSRIRKVDPVGIITTIAGTTGGYSGDGGPATAAQFNNVLSVCINDLGEIFIGDAGACRIRKIDTGGIVRHVAGDGVYGFLGEAAPALTARITHAFRTKIKNGNELYFADIGNRRIRKIDSVGIITTFAGTGGRPSGGDGGVATAATFSAVGGIAFDNTGSLYVSDTSTIRKIDSAGIITTIAGIDTVGYSGDGGPATAAKLGSWGGLAINVAGDIFFSDYLFNCVRKIASNGIITTVAGNGTAGYSGDSGMATTAMLRFPRGITIDDIGNLFICDAQNHRIRKVTFNHASAFTTTTSHYYLCPGSGDVAIDSLLGVTDIDTGQVLTWAVQSPAMHGTAVVSYSDTNTGGVQYPMGATYEGDSTLTLAGIDSFTVSIRDQLTSRIITKKIIIHLLPGGAGSIAGADSLCLGDTSRMAGVTPGGAWGTASGGAVATVSTTGLVTAVASGYDTAYYAFTNTCVTDTAYHALRVDYPGCTLGVAGKHINLTFTIIPNPTSGTFQLQLPSNELATITIKDLLGKTIHQTTTQQTTNTIYLDNTPAGIYLLTVRTAAGVQCGRLVVE